jgi:hypothetical protein
MRRTRVTAILLALAVGALAPACVSGSIEGSNGCSARSGQRVAGSSDACSNGHQAGRQPAHCGLRTFLPFPCPRLLTAEMVTPLFRATGQVAPSNAGVPVVSSAGSPETDRGPPRG